MQEKFRVMLDMQHRMNTRVHQDWIAQGFAWHRALWIECGELIDHHGFKWWKKQSPDMEQVKLEIVDIWHFGMSMLFDGSNSAAEIAAQLAAELNAATLPAMPFREAVEDLACHVLAKRHFCVRRFWRMMVAADMSADELYRAYVGKNVLNFFRQDHGYKDGSYRKVWAGREDNEHLAELAGGLDSAAESYPERLYEALHTRYFDTMEEETGRSLNYVIHKAENR